MPSLYICKNECHIGIHLTRCPQCGEWLTTYGEDTPENREKVQKMVSTKHQQVKKDFKNSNFV